MIYFQKEIESKDALSTKKQLLVRKAFDEYWQTGGCPAVAGLSRLLRIRTQQEYFHTILFRDLVERHDVAHPKAVTDLGLKTGTIVTRNEDERMGVEAGTIEVVPAWRFLLDFPESAE